MEFPFPIQRKQHLLAAENSGAGGAARPDRGLPGALFTHLSALSHGGSLDALPGPTNDRRALKPMDQNRLG